jgi:integrase
MQTEQESSTPASNQYTFGAQSAVWLQGLETQRRKPVAPATIATFTYHVKRLVPLIGADTPLANIESDTLRDLVGKLLEEELSAKTISEMLITVKQVVASAVDRKGLPLFPKTFNAKFIDAPPIAKQKRPCPTREKVEEVISHPRDHQQQLLFSVLSGSGLRISEALAIRVHGNEQQTSWSADSSVITVRAIIYEGKELLDHTKTQSGQRDVDLHPDLNAVIAAFAEKHNRQVGDFLFQGEPGQPMDPRPASNLLRKFGVQGFHGMRRFRLTILDNSGVPRGLAMYWGGHAAQDVHDLYVKSGEDVALRKSHALRIGLGFDLDKVGHPAPHLLQSPNPPHHPSPLAPQRKSTPAKPVSS